jgi:lysozyme
MISERGLAIIREFEGLRLKAYPDPASGGDPWTIGYGHTLDVEPGDTCTLEEAEQWLLDDCADAEVAILRHVKVPLSQGQLDALISFVFNLGAGNFAKSTLLRKLNAGDHVGAWQEFGRWNKAAGKVMPGLSRRRAAEAKLFAQSTEKPTNAEAEKPTNHTEPIPAQNTPQQIQEPSEEGSGAGVPAKFNAIVAQPEATTMPAPLIPILAAVLPSLIRSIPDFGKLFSSGSEVSERNVKAVEMAVGIVQEAVGARNAQEAAEIVASDPVQAQAAQEAVRARWHELTEVGGGIESARKADVAFVAAGSNPLASPAFIISLALLVMPIMLLVDVFYVHPGAYDGPLRTQIVTGVLMVIAMIGAYWLGSSFGSAKKTDLMGR